MNTTRTFVAGKTRVLTGIKPTGNLHIGNYAGAIQPILEFTKDLNYEVILMCADWHGMTDRTNLMLPGKLTMEQLAVYVTLGFDCKHHSLIVQSDFPQIQENAWALSCVTAVGLLERAHAYKDALHNGKEANAGLLYYPILMASDIVTFDAQVVPVGKDQAQHIEYTSDLAKSFNNALGADVFHQPKVLISAEIPILQGTDGRKMSKSYGNDIPIFACKKELEKKIKEIATDSKGLNDPKDPETCSVFQIFRGFASDAAMAHMADKLRKGTGYGYGHAKIDFLDEHERVFGSKREMFEALKNSPSELKKHVEPGYERATKYADQVRNRARSALQLKSFR